ncbi:hypothetical protein [Nocardia sp. NPDC004860]|uniref:hypothetical protein n=1 Tax=Nocardia sp. NPDC004860 TaxID=3154557 RepID=UPI0033A95DB5
MTLTARAGAPRREDELVPFDRRRGGYANTKQIAAYTRRSRTVEIAKGTRLVPIHDTALGASQVTAVRHNPIPYAEVRPVGGGRVCAVSLTDLQRDFRILRKSASAEDDSTEG